ITTGAIPGRKSATRTIKARHGLRPRSLRQGDGPLGEFDALALSVDVESMSRL
ncbi:MAG: hypothetical protein JWM91_3193, partial [Rhodospirillales bacterium]|nr:hypothetical protein [Rhodospirillales bacterium]